MPAARKQGDRLRWQLCRDKEVCAAWNAIPHDPKKPLVCFNSDFLEVVTNPVWSNTFKKDTWVYLDPPYPLSTRTSDTRYTYEMSDEDHRRLLHAAKLLPSMVAISSYPNPLYDEILADWRFIDFTSTDRGGNVRTERLYMNYGPPAQLHDYSYLGGDYREREVIARREKNFLKKISGLDPLERHRLFEKLSKKYPNAFLGDASRKGKPTGASKKVAVAAH